MARECLDQGTVQFVLGPLVPARSTVEYYYQCLSESTQLCKAHITVGFCSFIYDLVKDS